jgi:hypothetical protein
MGLARRELGGEFSRSQNLSKIWLLGVVWGGGVLSNLRGAHHYRGAPLHSER